MNIRAPLTAPWFDAECHAVKVKRRRLEKAYRRQPSAESWTKWRAQFTDQQQKFVAYWSAAVSSCQGDARALWSKLRPLLRPSSNATLQLTADDYVQFFTTKIDRIRASTATAPYPILEERHVLDPLSAFDPATAEEILMILNRSAAKQCQLDPVPTWLVKRASGILATVIANMYNASFQATGQQQEGDRSSAAKEANTVSE